MQPERFPARSRPDPDGQLAPGLSIAPGGSILHAPEDTA